MANLQAPLPTLTAGTCLFQSNSGAMAAAGNHFFMVGAVFFPTDTLNEVKTISAAGGGSIAGIFGGSNVFANAGTTVEVGIQDVSAGLPDGTFDVKGSWVGGTDTITDQTLFNRDMTTGTKDLHNGQIIAVGLSMVSRGGADNVTLDRVTIQDMIGNFGYPYAVLNGARERNLTPFVIVFDDTTVGHILPVPLLYNMSLFNTLISYNLDSTPDEYVGAITYDVDMIIYAMGPALYSVGAADNFEINIYEDPFGTPSLYDSLAFAGTSNFAVDGQAVVMLDPPLLLSAGDELGVSARPTTTNNIQWSYFDQTSGFDFLKKAQPFATVRMGSRSGNSGAFSVTQVYHLPEICVYAMPAAGGGGGGGGAISLSRVQTGH